MILSYLKKSISNYIFIIGFVVSKFHLFVIPFIVTNILTKTDFGDFEFYFNLVLFISPIIFCQIGETYLRTNLVENLKLNSLKIVESLQFIFFLSILIIFIAIVLDLLFDEKFLFTTLGIFIISNQLCSFYNFYLRAKTYKNEYFTFNLLNLLLLILCGIFLINGSEEVTIVRLFFFISIVNFLSVSVFNYFSNTSILLKDLFLKKNKIFEIFRLGIVISINSSLWWILNFGIGIIIKIRLGSISYAEYSIGSKFSHLITFIGFVYIAELQRKHYALSNKNIYFLKFLSLYKFYFLSILFFGMLMLIISPLILQFLYPSFSNAVIFIPVLCLSSIFSIFSGYLGIHLMKHNMNKWLILTYIFSFSIVSLIIFFFGDNLSIFSLCMVQFLAQVLLFSSRVTLFWQPFKIRRIC